MNVTVKVVHKFRDIETNEIHKSGDVITITKERQREIESVGHFVEEVKKEAVPKKKTAAKKKREDASE